MRIGDRIRALRDAQQLSQGDVEKRTGLLRNYLSRVENGHTIPSVETLQKLTRALKVPLYQLFYEGKKTPELLRLPRQKTPADIVWGRSRGEIRFWKKFRKLIGRLNASERQLLLGMARKMAKR